jgi:hypothetical protein
MSHSQVPKPIASTRRRRLNDSKASTIRLAVYLLLSVGVLNFALSVNNLWPTPSISARAEISIGVALVLVVPCVYSE